MVPTTVSFSPLVLSWTHSRSELRPSAKHPGLYDQPDEACKWLKSFRTLNGKFISQVCRVVCVGGRGEGA